MAGGGQGGFGSGQGGFGSGQGGFGSGQGGFDGMNSAQNAFKDKIFGTNISRGRWQQAAEAQARRPKPPPPQRRVAPMPVATPAFGYSPGQIEQSPQLPSMPNPFAIAPGPAQFMKPGSEQGGGMMQAQVVPPGAIGGDLGNPIYAGTPEGDAFMARGRGATGGDMANPLYNGARGEVLPPMSTPYLPPAMEQSPQLPSMPNPFAIAPGPAQFMKPGSEQGGGMMQAQVVPPGATGGDLGLQGIGQVRPMSTSYLPPAMEQLPQISPMPDSYNLPPGPAQFMKPGRQELPPMSTYLPQITPGPTQPQNYPGIPSGGNPNPGTYGTPSNPLPAPNPGGNPALPPAPPAQTGQQAYQNELTQYNSPEYAAYYNSLAPSTRAFMHPPGDPARGQYLASQAQDSFNAWGGKDPLRRKTGGIVALLNRR